MKKKKKKRKKKKKQKKKKKKKMKKNLDSERYSLFFKPLFLLSQRRIRFVNQFDIMLVCIILKTLSINLKLYWRVSFSRLRQSI